MKKKLVLSIFIASLMLVSAGIGVLAATKMTLIVNGKVAAVEPKVIGGVTYVPLRAAAELLGANVGFDKVSNTVTINAKSSTGAAKTTYDVTLKFPADKYPQTAAHIKSAIAKGESAICTIDRDGADANRDESLRGIPTKDGYDRDEWPMAMCAEGGEGADIAYVESSDNRGSGSWVGNQLEQYPDGTRVLFVVSGSVTGTVNTDAPSRSTAGTAFTSCADARSAGAAPVYRGDPGYSTKLDRDGDGVACEK